MITAAEMLRRLQSFNIVSETEDILIDSEREIIELNQQQLLSGHGVDGEELPYYQGELYNDYKQGKNPANEGRWDMRDSGESFRSMEVTIIGDTFSIVSSGEAQSYEDGTNEGRNVKGRIFGLDKKNWGVVKDRIIQPELVNRIATLTGAKKG